MSEMQRRWRLGEDFTYNLSGAENTCKVSLLNQAAACLGQPQQNGFSVGDASNVPTIDNGLAVEKDSLSRERAGSPAEELSALKRAYQPNDSDPRPLNTPKPHRSWWRQLLSGAKVERSLPALLAPGSEYAAGTAQFALLASRLQRWSAEQSKRVILVTSAVAGEGKSFLAVNLATILADLGSLVVLVDADLRTPSLDRCLGLNPPKGLAAYLAGEVELSECLYPTRIPRVTLLAAGKVNSSSTRALADSRAADGIQALRNLQPPHFVLIDSPSILSAAEVQILASLTDAVMMVVAANRTPRSAVQSALHAINGAPLFGIVLNRFEVSLSASRAAGTTPRANPAPDPTKHKNIKG